MTKSPFRFRSLAGCVLAACATLALPAQAAPLGQLRSVKPGADGHSWDLRTDSGAHVQVSLAGAAVGFCLEFAIFCLCYGETLFASMNENQLCFSKMMMSSLCIESFIVGNHIFEL